jgi:hypothetical protein
MDENGIDWLYGCGLVGFWMKSWANHISWFLFHPDHKSDPAWLTWARWPTQSHSLSLSEHIKRWWHDGWEWNWLALWMWPAVGFCLKSWANHISWFLLHPDHKSDPAWLTWAR